MSALGFTTVDLVQQELGEVLVESQQTECNGLIAEAEAFIMRFTGRSWVVGSPATEVLTIPEDGVVFLTNRPVTAITTVSVRSPSIGAAASSLVAGDTYELLDGSNGILLLATGYRGWIATVVYTHTNTVAAVPGDIRRACTLLTAFWMSPRLHPEREGLDRLRVSDGEMEMTISKREIPEQVMHILRARERVVFA